jgi:hypothetical protein
VGDEHDRLKSHPHRPHRPADPLRRLERCLTTLAYQADGLGASGRMPRLGCGHAGGRWEALEPLITRWLCARDIRTFVNDI